MLSSKIVIRVCVVVVLGLYPINLFSQEDNAFALQGETDVRITIDSSLNENASLNPFDSPMVISGLAFSGEIELHSDSSLVRLILTDANYNEYLIYETYPILSGSKQISVFEAGEESSLLNQITPSQVLLEVVDASVFLKELIMNQDDSPQVKTKSALAQEQTRSKIEKINQNIKHLGQKWVAGETSISGLSYQEKKSRFGGKVPNFQGFEYYVGGVFVLPGELRERTGIKSTSLESKAPQESSFPFEFSWGNRHGSDWVTPVKNQGSCNACYAYGAVAATELLVNLYFNRHLNYDLSEQQIVSCTEGTCDGGLPREALDFAVNIGLVPEDCFPYSASESDCSLLCDNPSERIHIESWARLFSDNNEDRKREIMAGATLATIHSWNHSAPVIGYKVLEVGDNHFFKQDDSTSILEINVGPDDPMVGETAWLIKNSWGESWGMNGFGYVAGDLQDIDFDILKGPVDLLILNAGDIACTDTDGDGYYSWGMGLKPAHCPESPDEPDGDDSDPCIGPSDEFGNPISVTPRPEATDTVILYGQEIPDLQVAGSQVRWYSDVRHQNLVNTGNYFATGHSEPGEYNYFVTQTLGGCESTAYEVSLSIVLGITRPMGHDTTVVEGETAVLWVDGEPGAEFHWYEDPQLTVLLDEGESIIAEQTKAGSYQYFVTQTLYQIESEPDTVYLEIVQEVSIPDTAFLYALFDEGVDTKSDKRISYAEAEAVTSLNISGRGIKELTGIEAFTNLEILHCNNNELTLLDVSHQAALAELNCGNNKLTLLDVSTCTELRHLEFRQNEIGILDVSKNSGLISLDCSYNQLTNLDVSFCLDLEELACQGNRLFHLDPTNNFKLRELSCYNNFLSTMDLKFNGALVTLECQSNQLSGLILTYNPELETLYCSDNQILNLDLSENISLRVLNCRNNKLLALDVSANNQLLELSCAGNMISTLNLCNNGFLGELILEEMQSLDTVFVWSAFPEGVHLFSHDAELSFIPCKDGQTVFLPDTAFLHALEELGVDKDGNSLISFDEAMTLTKLDLSSPIDTVRLEHGLYYGPAGAINKLIGIEAFVNLDTLICSGNNIDSLDLSANKLLTYADCRFNGHPEWHSGSGKYYIRGGMESLNVTGCSHLAYLHCGENRVRDLDVSGSPSLAWLDCTGHRLAKLDLTQNTKLKELYCSSSRQALSGLDLTRKPELRVVQCSGLGLNKLNLEYNGKLEVLDCSDNDLGSLDLSHNSSLESLNCEHNNLNELDLRGNPALRKLHCSANPLHSIDVSKCTLLSELLAGNDGHLESMVKLKSIDISNNRALTRLSLSSWLQSLDVSKNPSLSHIKLFRTAIGSLDFSKNEQLSFLKVYGGPLSNLNLCNNISLDSLVFHHLARLDSVVLQEGAPGEVYKEIENCPSVGFFDCSVGIESSNTAQLSIYPNPVRSLLTIQTSLPGNNTIEINSLNGQVIYRSKMEGSTCRIDMSSYRKGSYFVTIRSKDLLSISKIIKL